MSIKIQGTTVIDDDRKLVNISDINDIVKTPTNVSPANAWFQYFDDGYQNCYGKNGSFYVRAVRR